MPPRPLEGCGLWSTIQHGHFWIIPEEFLILQVYDAFQPETDRLRSADAIERNTPPPPSFNGNAPKTPSEIIYGENFDEVNRTYVGILALRWVWIDDYERFVRGQTEQVKLTRKSFAWLRDYFQSNIKTDMDILSVVLAMVVNDLGKDPSLVDDLFEEKQISMYGSNHDQVLLEAAKEGMVPSLRYLDASHYNDIMLGLELGSELNAGQLAQAENVPVNLEPLLNMQGNERAFNLKYIEQMLDVAGAAGHVFADGIKNLIEPVFQAFKTVHEVSMCIIQQQCTLREGYDKVLSNRAALLHNEGFRLLSVKSREERALLRLLTMGRAASLDQALLFDSAFQALDASSKKQLIHGLNIDAIDDDETAVIPYYMPAMIAETLRSTRDSGKEQDALTSLMKYLSRTLHWPDDDAPTVSSPVREGHAVTWPGASLPKLQLQIPATAPFRQPREGRVFERNMSRARATISSPQFKSDPTILDSLEPPEGHLLSRRRTSTSV